MKKILFILLALPFITKSQVSLPTYFASPKAPTAFYEIGWMQLDSGFQFRPRINNYKPLTGNTGLRYSGDSVYFWAIDSSKWIALSPSGSGGYVTLPQLNDTLTNYVRLATQNPTATLTASPTTYEFTSASTQNINLIWTSGRLAATSGAKATNPLASIVVGGITQSFSQPSPGSTVGSTQALTISTNSTQTFSNLTTTTDSKTATASVTISYLPKRYYGLVSDTTAIGTTGYNDAILLALTQQLSTSNVLTNVSTGTPSGSQFWVFLYPANEGALTSITFNGFPSLAAMNTATRSFTNALGYTQNYILYWNKNAQTTASTVSTN